MYDPASQSVKLVFWKQYLESYLAKDLEARKTKKLPEQTVVYDPKTKGVKLQLLSEYLKVRDRRIDLEDCSWGITFGIHDELVQEWQFYEIRVGPLILVSVG